MVPSKKANPKAGLCCRRSGALGFSTAPQQSGNAGGGHQDQRGWLGNRGGEIDLIGVRCALEADACTSGKICASAVSRRVAGIASESQRELVTGEQSARNVGQREYEANSRPDM